MKWRKQTRWLHRKLGYIFFGMTIMYGISGIALNHHIARHWTPSTIEKNEKVSGVNSIEKSKVTKSYIDNILEITGEKNNYKSYYFPTDTTLMLYLKHGHINVNINSGEANIITVRNRRFFREVNFLHYNKPKQLWTYFSDLFAFSLIVIAVTGLLMAKGKRSIYNKNIILVIIGFTIPLIFLFLYL